VQPTPSTLGNATVKQGRKAKVRFKVANASCATCTVTIMTQIAKGK